MKGRATNSIMVILSAIVVFGFAAPSAVHAAGPAAVNLGSAGNFAILAKTGVSTTGTTAVVGDIGVSPAQATYITGFSPILPAASAFSTSALVTGKIYAPGYADPTAANLTTAVLDMQNAYTDAAGRAATVTELGAGNIGGLTLVPGVYKWSTGVTIPTDVTLSGSANDVWIFQIAQNLSVSSGAHIILSGGAQAANIFWQVAGQTTVGTTAVINGNILDQTAIVLNTGATLNGRALAQSAVTLDASAVTMPTSVASTPAVPATPAVSATPAVPAVTTAVPATSATPATAAVPATESSLTTEQQKSYDDLISVGASHAMALEAVRHIADVATAVTAPATSSLTAHQQKSYDDLISVGASHAMALDAVSHIAATPSASAFGQQVRAIANDLEEGSKSGDVSALQQFLISKGKGSASQALSGVGATAYFGSMTRAALAEFQASVGISPATGYFGQITRAYIKAHE